MFAGLACAAPQHALTLYNEPPKYPANFKHVEYVNPDAPKGGTFRKSALGSFDSLNPFILKGTPAGGIIAFTFATLMQATDTGAPGLQGLLAMPILATGTQPAIPVA